jgi:hypothetical protein
MTNKTYVQSKKRVTSVYIFHVLLYCISLKKKELGIWSHHIVRMRVFVRPLLNSCKSWRLLTKKSAIPLEATKTPSLVISYNQ